MFVSDMCNRHIVIRDVCDKDYNTSKANKPISYNLKCICNENFDFFIFALSDNFIFSDHFNTNLVENFELEVCEFCV